MKKNQMKKILKRAAVRLGIVWGMVFFIPWVPVVLGEETDRKAEEITVLSEIVYDANLVQEPDCIRTNSEGEVYELQSWEIEEIRENGRKEQVEESVTLRGLDSQEEIAPSRRISRVDDRTGQTVIVEGQKTEVFSIEERWLEGAEIPLICYLCRDERGFADGEIEVYNANRPPEEACRKILGKMGLSEKDYQIENISWDGEAFESGDGYLCRMVKAEGRKKVKDYQVVYEGTAVYPEVSSYRCRARYALRKQEEGEEKQSKEEGEKESGKEREEAGESQKKQQEQETERQDISEVLESGKKKILHFIRERKEIVISAGALLPVVIFLAVIPFILIGKKKKK